MKQAQLAELEVGRLGLGAMGMSVAYAGAEFKVLDPIAMLKAKASNVRDLDQVGPPPRHDGVHLQLIVRCVPAYLRRLHAEALTNPALHKPVAKVFSRAFEALKLRATREGLQKIAVDPSTIMPAEFAQSPIPAITNAYTHQMPRLRGEKNSPSVSL